MNIILKEFGEPNNTGGNSTYIAEKCINRLNTQGSCLNDDHCEYGYPSICQKKLNNLFSNQLNILKYN
jgi:hypothetical protein